MTLERSIFILILALSLAHIGCSESEDASNSRSVEVPEPGDPWQPGPFVPGQTTTTLGDATGERALTVEIWYPANDSAAELAQEGAALEMFEPETERDEVERLLAAAPDDCPTRRTAAARDAALRAGLGPLPLVVFSHCMNCGRYSSFSIAERLASHGFMVVAPDHAGPRPFVEGAAGETLTQTQLEVRIADVDAVLDAALDGTLFAETAALEGVTIDDAAIGMMGHSFGSVTTGFVTQNDGRIAAAAGLAAPMDNPLFRGVEMPSIDVPLLFVLAEEDNSIQEIGNRFMRENFDEANSPVWRVDLADAGHWSVSDVAGLTDAFSAGCGEGVRHSEGRSGEPFTYIPVATGIETTAHYVTTFFLATLTAHAQAQAMLDELPVDEGVTVFQR